MTEQESALEAWSHMEQAPYARRTVADYMPLLLSAAGALGVAPFAVIRWISADWLLALIDTLIVLGFAVLGTYVYRTRRVRYASIAIALLSVCGAVVTVYMRGPQQVYWIYPALMASFYLLKPREAIVLTASMGAAVLPVLATLEKPFAVTTVAITMLVTTAFAYAFSVMNNRQHEKLLDLATKDPLTGAGNRRALVTRLSEIIAAFQRTQSPASVIILDLDHFKTVNDDHGHAAGDRILQTITRIIELHIRASDRLYRIGGEEFVVVTDGQALDSAAVLAEKLRLMIDGNRFVPGLQITVSLGVAQLQHDETVDTWLTRADDALYRAKHAGRNTIRLAG